MFENKWLLSNRGFGWKNNVIITCQYSLSVRHKSNGLVHTTVKQFNFVLCSAKILETIHQFCVAL